MMLKRVVTIVAMVLMVIGMAVSASAEFVASAAVDTGISIVCEVHRPEVTTTQLPEARSIEPELLKVTNQDSATVKELTNELAVARTSSLAGEKSNEEVIEEPVQELAVTPIEEGTIIDPNMDESEIVLEEYVWDGEVINSYNGTVAGPNGKETYYNLDMTGVIWIMEDLGYDYEYWVREDGVKMYGPFIMVAADLNLRPRGSIIKTSLGWAMVCDTGEFVNWNPTQLDIAVTW